MIFNSTEREGVLVMLLLITGLIVIPRFVRSGKPAFFLLPEVINIEKDSLRPVSHREISPPLELNTADSSALVRIRGIGPYYASKIIKYDNLSFFVYSICFISITQNKRLICGQHRYSAVTCIVFR